MDNINALRFTERPSNVGIPDDIAGTDPIPAQA
jgi:hypothetical protein